MLLIVLFCIVILFGNCYLNFFDFLVVIYELMKIFRIKKIF